MIHLDIDITDSTIVYKTHGHAPEGEDSGRICAAASILDFALLASLKSDPVINISKVNVDEKDGGMYIVYSSTDTANMATFTVFTGYKLIQETYGKNTVRPRLCVKGHEFPEGMTMEAFLKAVSAYA